MSLERDTNNYYSIIQGAAHEHETQYLPGTVRDRIQDLMKSRKISQADLATRIGCSESTLSRFISGKTDKLGDENIIRIAKAFEVSTDFLPGVVDELDRKNYAAAGNGVFCKATPPFRRQRSPKVYHTRLFNAKSCACDRMCHRHIRLHAKANRVLLAPIGNPEPKRLSLSGHLPFSSHGGTQIAKIQFSPM